MCFASTCSGHYRARRYEMENMSDGTLVSDELVRCRCVVYVPSKKYPTKCRRCDHLNTMHSIVRKKKPRKRYQRVHVCWVENKRNYGIGWSNFGTRFFCSCGGFTIFHGVPNVCKGCRHKKRSHKSYEVYLKNVCMYVCMCVCVCL